VHPDLRFERDVLDELEKEDQVFGEGKPALNASSAPSPSMARAPLDILA